jgi:hypothetical protein
MKPGICCVYEIRDTFTGSRQIGATTDYYGRMRRHDYDLRRGRHHNYALSAECTGLGWQAMASSHHRVHSARPGLVGTREVLDSPNSGPSVIQSDGPRGRRAVPDAVIADLCALRSAHWIPTRSSDPTLEVHHPSCVLGSLVMFSNYGVPTATIGASHLVACAESCVQNEPA